MASVKIQYTCGCGYHTTELEAAVAHSDKYRHSLSVLGVIKKDKE